MINYWHHEMAPILVAFAITAFFLIMGAQKATWPARSETAITVAVASVMASVMVAVASVLFLIADQIMRLAVTFLLGIGG